MCVIRYWSESIEIVRDRRLRSGAASVREQGRRCLQTSVTTHEHLSLVSPPLFGQYTRVYANNSEPSQLTLSHFDVLPARLQLRYDCRLYLHSSTFEFVTWYSTAINSCLKFSVKSYDGIRAILKFRMHAPLCKLCPKRGETEGWMQ